VVISSGGLGPMLDLIGHWLTLIIQNIRLSHVPKSSRGVKFNDQGLVFARVILTIHKDCLIWLKPVTVTKLERCDKRSSQ
jgi:hypothetical protein